MQTTDHLNIGAMVFEKMDQIDFTGPFEVLSRLPNSTFHIAAKELKPVRDVRGLILTPETTLSELPQLDVLVIPGGAGVQAMMEDEEVLAFVRKQATGARCVLSVCTGAMICGAAGILKGVHATTHWASFHFLKYFGAIPVNQRVVADGKLVTAAGVTSGIDGALRVAAMLRGEQVARGIQLYVEYAPEPPFDCGTPQKAGPEIVAAVREPMKELMASRLAACQRVATRLGVDVREA